MLTLYQNVFLWGKANRSRHFSSPYKQFMAYNFFLLFSLFMIGNSIKHDGDVCYQYDRWLMNGQPVLQKHLLSTNGEDPEAEVNSATVTIKPFSRNGDSNLLPRWAQMDTFHMQHMAMLAKMSKSTL